MVVERIPVDPATTILSNDRLALGVARLVLRLGLHLDRSRNLLLALPTDDAIQLRAHKPDRSPDSGRRQAH